MAQGLTAEEVKSILDDIDGSKIIEEKTKRFLHLAEKVTLHAYKVTELDIQALRDIGCSDEELFETIAVASIINFSDRMADALGAPMEHFLEKMAKKS
jgi:alkylhydroperoxidase family enzyme